MNDKVEKISTYDEFCSPFVTPQQRKKFLLECARLGAAGVRRAWPDHNIRFFVFGSASHPTKMVNANSDLDIAISGTEHIDGIEGKYVTLLAKEFRRGLGGARHALPIDFLFFNVETPQTWLAEEILKNGVEI